MAGEIFGTVLRGLMEHEGSVMTMDQIPTLEVLYRRVGEDRVRQFGIDSAINRLPFDRHGEELAVHRFAELLRHDYDLMASPIAHQLPSWSRLKSCNPSLQADLSAAGQADRGSAATLTHAQILKRPNHKPKTSQSELVA